MPFYLYKAKDNNLANYILHRGISLAGYNLIFKAWEKKGRPIEQGWHIPVDELIQLEIGENEDSQKYKVIIDLKPSNKEELILLELLDIWIYTHGNTGTGKANWSPLLLRLQDCLYKELSPQVTTDERKNIISEITNKISHEDIFEFLYIHGNDRSWNWGRVGSVNGALLYKPALQFFMRHLS